MGASFEEKSVWVQLVATVLGFAGYMAAAGKMLAAGENEMSAYAGVFGVSVGLMVVVMVAGHIVAALLGKPEGPDERDRLIAWKAEHRSGWMLVTGVLVTLACMVFLKEPVWPAHMLVISLFMTTILGFLLRIVYYRKGV